VSTNPTARLYSIAIFVREMPQALEFYHKLLGLEILRQGGFGAELGTPEARLGVHPAIHPDAQAMVGRHTGITFQTDDILPLCERLHEHGIRFQAEPTRQAWGIMAMVEDPDGNVVALWQAAGDEEEQG
jgi:predicted enzyme related to lactoylglutathione lyase